MRNRIKSYKKGKKELTRQCGDDILTERPGRGSAREDGRVKEEAE